MKIFQKGFNYSQDGPGNRLIYHLQGCNMHCPWCANPEGLSFDGVLLLDEEWILESICPHHAIKGKDLDRSICKACHGYECIREHCTKGLRMSCFSMTPGEILEEAIDNSPMFYDGGGVTFTGGEATAQYEELARTLKLLKENGIRTCIETNGTHPRLDALMPLIDDLIMDCKLMDPDKHRKWTGLPIDTVKKNIRIAAGCHPHLHVRVPLIGGVNTCPGDIEAFISFFDEIKGDNVTFEALLYHEYGRKKWKECGLDYKMNETTFVDDKVRPDFIRRIRAIGGNYQAT